MHSLRRRMLIAASEGASVRELERMAAANVVNHSLTDFDTIAEIAAEEGYIRREDVARLIAFRNNPSDESWMK